MSPEDPSFGTELKKPRPFITILEDSPRRGKKKKPEPLYRLKPSIRKEGRKALAYAEDGAKTTARNLKRGGATIIRTSRDSIRLRAGSFASFLGGWRRTGSERSAETPRYDFSRKLSSLADWTKRRAESIAGLPRAQIVKTAVLVLAGIATISAGATAIVVASRFPIASSALVLPDEESAQKALLAYIDPLEGMDESPPPGSLPPIPVSVKLSTYSVRSGDSLDRIAKRFGLRQDTIISANSLQKASSLRSGLQLRIPNMDGISHKVRKGESLSGISRSYGIDVTRIVDANDLASGTIAAGQSLFIPNARLSSASLREFYGERFIWPARGRISSPYGYRANPFTGLRTFHSAIDIVLSTGTKVKATAEGKVADTGYNSVFGNYVILKHASGYQSLYAHLSSIAVHEGASISQGSTVGLSGNTGQSTGPHLHFSLFKGGQALDPTKYVK